MNKLDLPLTNINLTPVTLVEPANWILVLVPAIEADFTPAINRIWELANTTGSRIRFIGLYENPVQELILRRQLANMSAMLNTSRVFTETEIVAGNDWVAAIRSRWHSGDLVVCFAEQRVGPLKRSLSSILSSLDVPLYILSDSYLQKNTNINLWAQIFAWVGSIAILGGFFLLQIRIHHLMNETIETIMLLISVTLELWMIWVWNSLFS